MNEEEEEKLENLFNDPSNKHLIGFTTKELQKIILNVLNDLDISSKQRRELVQKLKQYQYIDEMNQLKSGSYIRWISMKSTEIKLMQGALFCEYMINDSGIYLLLKSFRGNKIFQIPFDSNLIFQKLTNGQEILLATMNYILKK
jgi:hypothetical protein